MSDGTVWTAFVGVDRTPGSRLAHCISELRSRMPHSTPEASLEFLRDQLKNYLREPAKDFTFPWDKGPDESISLRELFSSAKYLQVGHYPLRSQQTHAVVPLEEFLKIGYGTCLHKAIIASLLLESLGIPHRLVNGATQLAGHTWIVLPDGRVLDPSLGVLEQPKPSTVLPGRVRFGDVFAFENQVWPYLALP
jgi:hypothetical protein